MSSQNEDEPDVLETSANILEKALERNYFSEKKNGCFSHQATAPHKTKSSSVQMQF